MDREEQVTCERDQRDVHPHVGAPTNPAHDQQDHQSIDTVIDEVTELGPFDLAPASQTAVHRITEPLHHIAQDREPQGVDRPFAAGIAKEDHYRAKRAEPGQPIRRNPARHPRAQPVEQAPFPHGQHVLLDTVERGGCVGLLIRVHGQVIVGLGSLGKPRAGGHAPPSLCGGCGPWPRSRRGRTACQRRSGHRGKSHRNCRAR